MGHMSGDILCIGSVLWDVIGRTQRQMREGSDVAGEITRLPGGVALNIAMTCVRFGLRPVLLSAVGRDRSGEELLERCAEMGIETSHIYRAPDLATDRYMAIEGPGGVIAAIADARTLEHSGAAILSPLLDGALGSPEAPFSGIAALDGNLTLGLLEEIAQGNMLAYTDMRIAPASPGKADRLMPFVNAGRGVLYVNCEEAGIICGTSFATAAEAAQALIAQGSSRALVTHGPHEAADATSKGVVTGTPPQITVRRLTGAGDTFMAAHIAAELRGADRRSALQAALKASARYVSEDGSP